MAAEDHVRISGEFTLLGFSIFLSEPHHRQLAIKHRINGREGTVLKVDRSKVGEEQRRKLDGLLDMVEGSSLTVELYEKRLTHPDRCLGTIVLSSDEIWSRWEISEDRIKVITIDKPKASIWLIVKNPNTVMRNELESVLDRVQTARQKVEEFKDLQGHGVREVILELAKVLSQLHPVAKIVVGCVSVIHEKRKTQEESRELFRDLADSMIRVAEHVKNVSNTRSKELKLAMKMFLEVTEETMGLMESLANESTTAKIMDALIQDNKEKIERIQKCFNTFKEEFDRAIGVDTNIQVANTNNRLEEDKRLKQLGELRERLFGGHQPIPSHGADKCLKGTRQDILTNVITLINDPKDRNIIWIKGSLGVGKSALAASIRSLPELQEPPYFAFIRNDSAFTSASALWRNITFQLALRYPSILEHILKISTDFSILQTPLLFGKLVKGPLSALSESDRNLASSQPFVVIVDALDECGDLDVGRTKDRGFPSKEREDLLQTLSEWQDLPKNFKLVVTSRPNKDIERFLSPSISIHISIPSGSAVTDQTEAFADIQTFFENRLAPIKPTSSSNWHIEAAKILTPHAVGIFQWANTIATLFREADDPGTLLEEYHNAKRPRPDSSDMERLSSLYRHVLKASFDRKKEKFLKAFRTVAGAMVFAMRPLRDEDVITHAGITQATLNHIRAGLSSVVDPGEKAPLRFTHKSFDDFLLSNECPPEFAIVAHEQHHELAKLCLATMSAELGFNMSKLETSCLKNADQPNIEEKIKTGISPLLSYSCRFFAHHLSGTRPGDRQSLMNDLKKVVNNQLLFWFEAMSLLKKMNWVVRALRTILDLCDAQDHEFSSFVRDAVRFVLAFWRPISLSAPHIYISALPFSPTHSKVAERFRPKFPHTIEVTEGRPAHWPSSVFVVEHDRDPVKSLVVSRNEKYFAYGDSRRTVYICDVETGNLIKKLHLDLLPRVSCTALSPDGKRLMVVTDLSDFYICNTESGKPRAIAKGIKTVTFSKDGLHIISCLDYPLRIQSLSASYGELEYEYEFALDPHLSYHPFSSSSDGQYVALAVRSGPCPSILVHDVVNRTHQMTWPQLDSDWIRDLAFSPDGRFIVAIADSRDMAPPFIHVYSSETGELILGPVNIDHLSYIAYGPDNLLLTVDHDGCVMFRVQQNPLSHKPAIVDKTPISKHGAVFSLLSDSRRLLVGYEDGRVKMLNLNEITSGTYGGDCRRALWGGVLSSSGEILVACSDEGIRFWNVVSGEATKLIETPCGQIALSHDGTRVASTDSHGTIRIWDTTTGELISGPRQVYGTLKQFFFRLHDNRLVTSHVHVQDGRSTVCIWKEDLTLELTMPCPVIWSKFYAVSIDALTVTGRVRGSSDDDPTQCYSWNPEEQQFVRLRNPTRVQRLPKWNPLVVFNQYFASVSRDHGGRQWSIEIQDVDTGDKVIGLWYDCIDPGSEPTVVFSLDGRKLVSSLDGTVRVWDTSDLTRESTETQAHARGFGDGSQIEDGWAMGQGDERGYIMFWVPDDHRHGLYRPRNVLVVGNCIPTKVDITRFKYGKEWHKCIGETSKWW